MIDKMVVICERENEAESNGEAHKKLNAVDEVTIVPADHKQKSYNQDWLGSMFKHDLVET